jgi:hypothetical protein
MSIFDPYYEWLGIPASDQPANHYRLLSIPIFEVNIEVIKSASERQTIFLRTFQAGEHASAAAHMLNEVAAARVCLLNAQQKEAYDTQLRLAQPVRPQIPRARPITVNPSLQVPHIAPNSDPQYEAVMVRKSKVRPRRVTPVWQRASVMVPTALVSSTVVILLGLFSFVNNDAPYTPPPMVADRQRVNLEPPVTDVNPESVVRPPTVTPTESTSITNSSDGGGSTVPTISADDAARFMAALEIARALQVQRKLSAAAAQLKIAKPLAAIPQYSSELTRTEFIQQLLEQFKRLTIIAIDSYIPGSEIEVGISNRAIVVEVSPSTLTLKVNGEVKEYMRDDLSLGVAMGIAATNFEDAPMKGFLQAAYLLTFPDRRGAYLVKAREFWELGDADLAPVGSFDKYLSDFENVDVPKLGETSVDDPQLTSDIVSGAAMIPVVDEPDMLELSTTMKNVRKALERRDMKTATTELAKAELLDKTPEVNEVLQRLAKMTELLNEFVKNSEKAIDEFVAGDKINAENAPVLSVARVTKTELVIKAGNRLQPPYARNQLPVIIAMGIADTCFQDNLYTTSLKAAFVATHKKPTGAEITRAKEWWEAGPEPIETFNLYLVDRYDFQDDNAKAEAPDNPQVFTIDLEKPFASYTLNIPYNENVEKAKITVQFKVTARGTRAFPVVAKELDPVGLSKSFEAEIMLGQHIKPAVGQIPVIPLNLVGDVLTRLSYDAVKKEFKIYVKPSTDVVAGKPNSTEVNLSAQKCAERRVTIEQTIRKFELEIPMHAINIVNLNANHLNLQGQYQAAVNAKDPVRAAQIGAEMAKVGTQLKGQISNQKIKLSRLPSFRFTSTYLASLARKLGDLKHLDIRYRIYQKVDDKDVLIIDGW